MSYENGECPVCGEVQSKYWYRRHLVEKHDWHYTDDSPDMPKKKEDI